ncbi:MAG: hypothetical protein AAF296_11620 [Pseudomonadota bacterium]
MPQTNYQPYIDTSLTRENLRRMSGGQGGVSLAYKDRDVLPMGHSPRDRHSEHLLDENNSERSSNRAPDLDSQFTDLDTAPLTLALDQNETHSVAADREPIISADSEQAPHLETSRNGPKTAHLSAQIKRRIVLYATTAAGGRPAYGRAQANIGGRGLCFGIGRFCQADGGLGDYLANCYRADTSEFEAAFNRTDHPHAVGAGALLEALQSDDETVRMADIGGEPLWSGDWIAVFKDAARISVFQDMQFKTASERYLEPLIADAQALSLFNEKGLALLTERAVLTSIEEAVTLARTVITEGSTPQAAIASLAAAASGGSMPGLAASIAISPDLSDTTIEAASSDNQSDS